MDNFIVSARKYRPQTFDSVVGQAHITTTLKNAIRNSQLAHAFLFCGPRGVGKTTCARILAKTINCEHRGAEGEACNACDSCTAFNEGKSFNIHELDAASNNSVDDIRLLTEQVRFAPQAGKYKVYIIDEVHMLSSQAFNAFLKTLEEPPPYAIFILATTEKHRILPTILSRCQIFDFKRIDSTDTVAHLKEICTKEGISADNDALHLIAQKSEGCMRDALSILDKIVSFTNGSLSYQSTLEHLNILDYDYYFRLMDAVGQQDAGAALLLFDEVLQKGFEGDHFLDGLSEFLRNLLVCRDKRITALMEVSDNLRSRYEEAAKASDTAFLVSALHLLNEADGQYRQARNKRLTVEMALIRLCYLQQAVALVSDERSGAVSKKKVADALSKPQPLRAPLPRPLSQAPRPANPVSPAPAAPPRPVAPAAATEAAPAPATSPAPPPAPAPAAAPPPAAPAPGKAGRKRSPAAGSGTLGSGGLDLRAIREEVEAHDRKKEEQQPPEPLEPARVAALWEDTIAALRQQQKMQAATNLEMAVVHVASDAEVMITCRQPIQQRFVEDERGAFAEALKKAFHNPMIRVSTCIDERLRQRQGPEILTQRQQLERMLKKYPHIKKLKDELNLDLG